MKIYKGNQIHHYKRLHFFIKCHIHFDLFHLDYHLDNIFFIYNNNHIQIDDKDT